MCYGLDKTKRPKCINYGCDKLVMNGGKRWRPHCSRCHKANYDSNLSLKEGVVSFKTGFCSNQDGHLGFECPMDYEKAPWAVGLTQIDHIDGDLYNNVPENCDELCDTCHKQKGKLAGDFKLQQKG